MLNLLKKNFRTSVIAVILASLLGVGVVSQASADGITWTSRSSAADNIWRSVTYGNGLFVAVSSSGTGNRVMTSPDGITWTSRTSAVDNNWYSVTYGNGLFVAVSGTGTGNRVMTSPDGITWTSRSSATDNDWLSIAYVDGLFVAVSGTGTNNRAMTSGQIGLAARLSAAEAARVAAVEASRVAAVNAAIAAAAAKRAAEQKELTEILALIPKIAELTLSLGETTQSLYKQKCVKGKHVKYVKNGAKCPKGYVAFKKSKPMCS